MMNVFYKIRRGELDRQHLHREVVEASKVRGGVPEGMLIVEQGAQRFREVLRVLQPKKTAQVP
jgi:hypothetical protein